MNPIQNSHRLLAASALALVTLTAGVLGGCQRSEQASVQPEKLASSSPSDGSASPPSPKDTSADKTSEAEAGAAPSGSAPGPLRPLAKGSPSSQGSAPLAPYASGDELKAAPEPISADPDPPADTARPAPEAKPKALPPPELTLLEAGKPPRKELRLGAKLGHSEAMRMVMQMSIGMEMNGKKAPASKLPPMLMDMTLKVADVNDQRLRYDFVLTDTGVPAAAGTPPKLVRVLEQALATLQGMKGHAVVTRRGVTKEAKISMPGKANAQTQQIVQGMEQALQQISAPFPEEPVGVGARWKLVTPMHQNGVSLQQTAIYTLKKITGDRLELDVTLTQTAPKQKVQSPIGVTVDLLSLSSKGDGDMTMKLDRLAPLTSQIAIDSAVSMGLPENKTMKMSSQMSIGINPPKN